MGRSRSRSPRNSGRRGGHQGYRDRDRDSRGERNYGDKDRGYVYGGRGGERGGRGGGYGGYGRDSYRDRDRDRDKDRGKKEDDRDVSSSRERSRERERRRRKAQSAAIARAGGVDKLASSEGRTPVKLFWDGFQWVTVSSTNDKTLGVPMNATQLNNTRKARRLYVGNLPLHLGLTETQFQEIMYKEMRERGICNDPNTNPVLCVWFAREKGSYGFIEFATVEETVRAMTLDQFNCLGSPIKVSRPNDYSQATVQQSQVMGQMGQESARLLQMQANQPPPPPGAPPPQTNSRILKIKQVINADDVEDPEEWNDVLDDMKKGAEPFGKVVSAFIVTPRDKMSLPDYIDAGDVYIEYESPIHVLAAIQGMMGRKYDNKPIQLGLFEEDKWSITIQPIAQLKQMTEVK